MSLVRTQIRYYVPRYDLIITNKSHLKELMLNVVCLANFTTLLKYLQLINSQFLSLFHKSKCM